MATPKPTSFPPVAADRSLMRVSRPMTHELVRRCAIQLATPAPFAEWLRSVEDEPCLPKNCSEGCAVALFLHRTVLDLYALTGQLVLPSVCVNGQEGVALYDRGGMLSGETGDSLAQLEVPSGPWLDPFVTRFDLLDPMDPSTDDAPRGTLATPAEALAVLALLEVWPTPLDGVAETIDDGEAVAMRGTWADCGAMAVDSVWYDAALGDSLDIGAEDGTLVVERVDVLGSAVRAWSVEAAA